MNPSASSSVIEGSECTSSRAAGIIKCMMCALHFRMQKGPHSPHHSSRVSLRAGLVSVECPLAHSLYYSKDLSLSLTQSFMLHTEMHLYEDSNHIRTHCERKSLPRLHVHIIIVRARRPQKIYFIRGAEFCICSVKYCDSFCVCGV